MITKTTAGLHYHSEFRSTAGSQQHGPATRAGNTGKDLPAELAPLLQRLVADQGSDLFVSVGAPPQIKVMDA